jgi:hypothetical protein
LKQELDHDFVITWTNSMNFSVKKMIMSHFRPGFLNDLYFFDPITLSWTEISAQELLGIGPLKSYEFSLSSVNNRLFICRGGLAAGNF